MARTEIRQMLANHRYLTPLLVLMTMLAMPAKADYCLQDWACVEIVKQSSKLEFWLTNNSPYPYTGTLEVEARGVAIPPQQEQQHRHSHHRNYSYTGVIQGHQRLLVLTLLPQHSLQQLWYQEAFYWTPGDMYAEHDADYLYAKPYKQGEHYPIVQGFAGGYSHQGASRYALDFAMPEGTPVLAARAGVVIDLQQDHNQGGPSRRYAKYANFVTVLHADGTTGEYYHLRHKGVVVAVGDKVEQGQRLGYSGNTGFSSLPHLHFAVYRAKSHGSYESLPFKLAD